MSVQINVQASQSALAQSIAQGVAAFNSRYAGQNQLNLQINARAFSQPLGRITSDLADFESALKASNARVLAFGASTAVLGGVVRSFKEIANVTIEVEKSLTDINRVLNLSTNNLQKFSSELFSISKQTASSFDDATKAALEFSRQGLNTEETLKRTADALTLVRLTGISSTKAVEDLTATINGFAKAGLTTSQVVNKLAAVEQDFAVSATDLTEALSRTGQAAQEAGVSFDELNALVTTAQQNTARGGAVIGNALKTIFTRLQRTETLDQLENFNIAVRDVQGNILPAVQILKNFADQYNNLADAQRAQLSEQVAGVYQVNILKGVIKDLNNSQGTYVQALERGAMAANEADIANEKLNKTLSALVTQTGVGLQQLANNVGKVTFAPIFEAIVSPVNDAVSYINDTLEGEGIGSIFANGLLKGVRNVIAGPGLAVAFAVIAKVAKNTFEDATKALPAILGLTTEAQKRANIEKSIISILQTQSNLSLALQGQQGNLSSQAATVLNYARLQTAQYQQQLQIAQQLAPLLAAQNVTVGSRGIQVGPKIKAGGHIPAFAEMSERMGAAMGGYKSGKVVKAPTSVGANTYMNSAEEVKYVSGFAQPFINPPANSKAGRKHRQNAINRTGVDPYMAAKGFIPNFAELLNVSEDPYKVIDGDTIKADATIKKVSNFRLQQVDAIETNQALGINATSLAEKAFPDSKAFSKVINASGTAAYGRLSFIDDAFSKELISQGLAVPDLRYLTDQNYKKLTLDAKDKGIGLWGFKDKQNRFSHPKAIQFLNQYAYNDPTSPSYFKTKIERNDASYKAAVKGREEFLAFSGFIPNFATPLSTARIPWFKKYSSKYKNIAGDTDLFKMGDFPTYGRGLDHEYAKKGNSSMLSYLHEDFVRSAINIALGSKKVIRPSEVGFKNKPISEISNENDFDLLYKLADGSYSMLELKQDFKNISGSITGFMNKKLENLKKENPELAKKVSSMIAVSNMPKFIDPTGKNPAGQFSEFEMAISSIVKDKYSNVDPTISAKLTKVTDGLLRRYEAKKNTNSKGFIPNFADFIETKIDILKPISKSKTIKSKQLFGKTLDDDAIKYLNITTLDRLNKFLYADGYLDVALGFPFGDRAYEKYLFTKNKGFIPNFANQNVMPIWMHPDAGIFQDIDAADHNDLKEIFKGKIPTDSLRGYVQGNTVTLDAPLNFLYRNDKNIKQKNEKIEKIDRLIKSKFGKSTKLQSQGDSDPLYKALSLQLDDFTQESSWKIIESLNASDFSAFMQSATHIRGQDTKLDAGLEEILKEKTLQQKQLMTQYGQGFGRYSGFIPNFANYNTDALERMTMEFAQKGKNGATLQDFTQFVIDLNNNKYGVGDSFHKDIIAKNFGEIVSDNDLVSPRYANTYLKGSYDKNSGKVIYYKSIAQQLDPLFERKHPYIKTVENELKVRFAKRQQYAPVKRRIETDYGTFHKQHPGPSTVNHFNNGFIPNFNFIKGRNSFQKNWLIETAKKRNLNLNDPNVFHQLATEFAKRYPNDQGMFGLSKGFIPNFAYKQSVMSLEESMSGNKAIFDTKPFPHIRNSSQPTFSSAISDHGGLKNALSDSMRNQEAVGLMSKGFVPNFATVNAQAGFGLPFGALKASEQKLFVEMNKALSQLTRDLTLTSQQQNTLRQTILNNANALQASTGSTNIVTEANNALATSLQQNANAQQKAAAIAAQQQAAQQPVQQTLSTRLLGTSRGGKFDKIFNKLSNNIGFNLAAPLLGGVAESLIAGGNDRSEMGYGRRLASSGASAALSGLSTGAAIGSAIPGIGTAAGAAIGALVGFGGAALNAKNSLEDLQKVSEKYRNETQTAVESGKGIINIVKSLGNLDPNSLEAFDANQKLQDYFVKLADTGLDSKFREAGNDIESMIKAIKDYETERATQAKRNSENEKRMLNESLSIEDIRKKDILKVEDIIEKRTYRKFKPTEEQKRIYGPNVNEGMVPLGLAQFENATYDVNMGQRIVGTGTVGDVNFQSVIKQYPQLFDDLRKVQDKLGTGFKKFSEILKDEGDDLVFNQGKLSDILKENPIEGIDPDQLADTLQTVAKDSGLQGKFIIEYFDQIMEGLASGKFKTAAEAATEFKNKIVARQESIRDKLFKYSQAIEQSISSIGIQIENYEFEKNFGKLNLEKSAQIINEGLSAISKNIDSAFKNQFDFLVDQTSNLQQKRLLDFEAQNFQKDLSAQAESRRLGRAKELVSVLQTALGETAGDQIGALIDKFRSTGKVDIGSISEKDFADGAKSKRAIEAFNLTTRLSDEEAKNKEDNARKIFMLEQAYANQSLKLKNETGKLDYDLSERRYKNAVREKELIDSISNQSKQIQIRGQAQIERSRIEADSPYFMLGQSEFTIADEKRRREAAATRSGFELEARQAIADAEIARIQREVLADNTNATLQNTTAIEALIMSMTAQGNKDFLQQNETLKAIDEQIKIQESFSTAESTYGITSNSELQNLRAKREAIVSSSNYAANKASSEIYNRQMENQIARQTLAERKVQGGAFAAIDLSTINDPIKYLDERASKEKVVLKSLESQKNILKIMGEDRALTTEESAKLKALDEQIAQQRKVVNEVDTANLAIKMKITNEDKKQYQYNKDALKRGTFTTGVAKAVGTIRSETEMFKETLGTTTVNAFRDGLVGAMDAALNKADDLESALMGVAAGFLREIQGVMLRNIANQLVGSVMPNFGAPATGNQRGGIIRAQKGMYISGGRTGDKNPALLEDGEYVLNRNAVKALGGPRAIDQLNFNAFPRFADGGDPGTMSASVSMGEPFERLSMYGREQSPEYQNYLEKLREAEAARDRKRAERKALINSLITTAITTGVMMGLTSGVQGLKNKFGSKTPLNKVAGSKPNLAQRAQLKKAGVAIGPDGYPAMQTGGAIGFNQGGFLPYGSRLTDSIPAYLTGGEYVINSRAVRKYGVGGLNRINSGVARFQDGGMVGDSMSPSSNSSNTSNSNISINITVNANNGKVGDQESDSTGDNTESNSKELSNRIKAVVLDVITTEQRSGGLLDSTKKK